MSRVLMLAAFFLLSSAAARGTCTGSATTWSCTAGSTIADVQAAVNSASDGATITFAAGSYSWSSGTIALSNSAGVTLICASVGACTVSTGSSAVIGIPQIVGTNTHFYRISGFSFQGGSWYTIWFGYSVPASNAVMTKVRVDHNSWTNLAGGIAAIACSDNSGVGLCYGVIDHNVMNCNASCFLIYEIGQNNSSLSGSTLGTAKNLFIEDNTVTISAISDDGVNVTDAWGGASLVIRHNNFTNIAMGTHGQTHAGGPQNVEAYNNVITYTISGHYQSDGTRQFHHQGSGTILVFNNQFTSSPSSAKNPSNVISINEYRANPQYDGSMPTDATQCDGTVNGPADAPYVIDGNRSPSTTWHGYPCWHQPGRDFSLNYAPMYAWNNFWSDTHGEIDLVLDDAVPGTPNYFSTHMQYNREAYNEVSASAQTSATSPFNGATGMGFGTLANRPTTCTTSTESAFGKGAAGVGYFATDGGAQGTLYTCSATNTWTVYYVPYTYPHPLASGTSSGAPAPPTNLAATVQ